MKPKPIYKIGPKGEYIPLDDTLRNPVNRKQARRAAMVQRRVERAVQKQKDRYAMLAERIAKIAKKP